MRLLILLLLAACPASQTSTTPAGPALPALPSLGGPVWLELQSEHFTMWTDAPEARGRELIREMEHLRQIVLGVGLASGAAPGRSLVIAMRDTREVGEFVPKQFIAYAFGNPNWMFQPVILFAADVTGNDLPVITHELTHVISYNIIRKQPRWFAEGLANFFATVRRDPSATKGDVGRPLDYVVARLRTRHPTPVATMFACKEHDCMDDMFYATASAMFSMLVSTRPAELTRYTALLDRATSFEELWKQTFPDLTPAAFDEELRQWLRYGRHTILKFTVKLQAWSVTKRVLTDADVLAARGLVRFLFAPTKPEPPAELLEAVHVDADHMLANYLIAAARRSFSVEEAQRLSTKYPDDWRAWWLLGLATKGAGAEGRTAHEKTCALMPAAGATPDPRFCSTP